MQHVGSTASQIGVSRFTTQFGRIMNVVYMTVLYRILLIYKTIVLFSYSYFRGGIIELNLDNRYCLIGILISS